MSGYNDDRWPVLDIPAAVTALLHQLLLVAGRLNEERASILNRLHLLDLVKCGYVATHDERFTNVGEQAVDGSWFAVANPGCTAFSRAASRTRP